MFRSTSRYQYGAGVGDVFLGMCRCFTPVAIKAAKILLRACSDVFKISATVTEVIKSMVQPTVGAVPSATVDQVGSKIIEIRDKHDAAQPPNRLILVPERVQPGSGKNDTEHLYIRRRQNLPNNCLPCLQLFIIFTMATIGIEPTEDNTREIDLYGSIMKQNIIENELNREYALLASIQQGAHIKFLVMGSNDLFLDLINSRLHVLAKITKADVTSIEAYSADSINMPLH